MRALLTLCILVAATSARATLAPYQVDPNPQSNLEDWSFALGPAAASLDSNYLTSRPDIFAATPIEPCRLDRSQVSNEVRIAYSCR